MNQDCLVSIIVNNYNYARFLGDAIDSAINQTYSNTEVIVVDDGSTDESREIIANYGDKIRVVLKENGGQASAFNAGYEECHGDIVVFLDSDDVLLPSAISYAVQLFKESRVSKAQWPLWEINEHGKRNGRVFPSGNLPQGNLQNIIIENGPDSYNSPPTSGNAWNRSFLEKVFPIPAEEFRINADGYLFMLAPLFGCVKSLIDPQGCYRIHGSNNFKGKIVQEETLALAVKTYDRSCLILKEYLELLELPAKPENWKSKSWFYKIYDAIAEIKELIPINATFIFVDEGQWGAGDQVGGRKIISFPCRNGQYYGPPPDDAAAIQELKQQRDTGASFIVFAWPSFWWLDYYSGFHNYLVSNFKCILKNDRIVIFDLINNDR